MTLRSATLNERERQAHAILDQVKTGLYVPAMQIRWALVVLGDVE